MGLWLPWIISRTCRDTYTQGKKESDNGYKEGHADVAESVGLCVVEEKQVDWNATR